MPDVDSSAPTRSNSNPKKLGIGAIALLTLGSRLADADGAAADGGPYHEPAATPESGSSPGAASNPPAGAPLRRPTEGAI